MLVVSDITDVIMPSPEDLLVNLNESRNVVDSLLDSLVSMFQVILNSLFLFFLFFFLSLCFLLFDRIVPNSTVALVQH